ncbi:TRAP transporter small permease [Pseudohalocynthiibacter aestuariivivens]|jgi:C4-dicarboxylate transporter, DctQ subunit|uniref:TRAP transporter small permease protein n=1 Tax=Pseudohalocynthiibacter aestuariivivens TaxID=1591409 RepID=A0ABV5JLP4_9RHOB|nr:MULTISPECIES: TRAP transporter small permease [Pseudohalocynthiibacter]MBS9716626.1 TRAP transporter small permease [Pseudohalocynthiibacter aestuariivivens]MCK0101708.1 TRAP transporter small permease [Pseudohalocynthiibacter sp. F2068]
MHPKPGETFVDKIEETLISILLGAMTLITFANVIARYGFNSNILWALEMTVFLFGWLVLLGASYAVKKGAHLGVDAIINILSPGTRRLLALISVAVCIAFSVMLLKGAWDYWANFANLPGTTGRWFPTGFEDMRPTSYRGWYEVNDIPHPGFLGWMEGAFNEGESYNKLPRMIPYAVLPLSMALLLYRFIQVALSIWSGKMDRLVASHEVEDEIQEIREQLGDED